MTLSEKNQIYDLLKQVTAVIEEAQRRIPETYDGNQAWGRLRSLISSIDNLYADVEDIEDVDTFQLKLNGVVHYVPF